MFTEMLQFSHANMSLVYAWMLKIIKRGSTAREADPKGPIGYSFAELGKPSPVIDRV